jgi:lysophospholipase L1-like esterase
MRKFVLGTLMAAIAATAAYGQLAEVYDPPRANCCLVNSAKTLADQLQDWNQLGRYYAANQDLKKQPPNPRRVVFMGDSITDGWRLEEYFAGKPYVNRGISGQVTAQMLVRMYPDVIDLKPGAMVVLAGTNDVARNNGPQTAEQIEQNIMAMTELAQHHNIKVILCSILPISDYPFERRQAQGAAAGAPGMGPGRGGPPPRRQTEQRPPADIIKLNTWMKSYAASVNAIYVDYFAATVDEKGWLKDNISADGLHPNAEGYKIMAPLVDAAIQKALP